MKKLFLLLLITAALFTGCEKDYNNIVDNEPVDIQVTSVKPVESFYYVPGDSLVAFTVQLKSADDVRAVYFNIYSPDDKQLNTDPVFMYDNGLAASGDEAKGDKKYSNKFPMQRTYPVGNYTVRYFVTGINGQTNQAAVQMFSYNNGQDNVAPVISNLVAPDTATIGDQKTLIFLSVDVSDSNGLSDVKSVYFNSFLPPDGRASKSNPFKMYDNGGNGDQVAHDGTYSLIIELPPSGVTKGVYRWEFQAEDRGKLVSNKIVHNIVIQ